MSPKNMDAKRCMSPKVAEAYSSIPELYRNRSVFITGGTGFVGKVLMEKLLRSCPDLKNIYVLIRSKENQSITARLNDSLSAPLFDKIRAENPNALHKVLPIAGDVATIELGISDMDQRLLCENVSIVFHTAANVRFNERLDLSIKINLLGAKCLLKLCSRMPLLEAIVHVSTAFCNCDNAEIAEQIYPTDCDPNKLIELIEWLPVEAIERITPSLLGNKPNTYLFVKSLVEQLLHEEGKHLPLAIVRPSIVLASHADPLPGWIDNWYGPTFLLCAAGNGLLRTKIVQKSFVCDVIPVDIVTNVLIAVAWQIARTKPAHLRVFNCVTSHQTPITWGEFCDKSIENLIKNPMENPIWYPSLAYRTNRTTNDIQAFLTQSIPALCLDALAKMRGKQAIMQKVQQKVAKANEILDHFGTHQWQFSDDNVRDLLKQMSAHDQQQFQVDVRAIDWNRYMETYMLGMREHLCKQKPETLPASRIRMNRLFYLHRAAQMAVSLATAGLALCLYLL